VAEVWELVLVIVWSVLDIVEDVVEDGVNDEEGD
jgi:hypothetical protein